MAKLTPRISTRSRIARVREQLENAGLDRAEVRRGAAVVGWVTAASLARAVGYGLGARPVAEVLDDPSPGAGRKDRPARVAGRLRRRAAGALLARLGRIAADDRATLWLVGGAPRDLLREAPLGDLDLAIEGDVEQLARRAAREIGGELRLHPRFGTASLLAREGLRLDLARTRRERYARPASLPHVEDGSLAEDLQRRDFTVNALAVCLHPRRFGQLCDPFGGRFDLRRGLLRVLHGLSFFDDPTRAFRMARFAARLAFAPSTVTGRLVRGALRFGAFDRLSGTRLRREIEITFEEPTALSALRWIRRLGLGAALHPRLRLTRSTEARFRRALGLLARHPGPPRWSVLLGVVLAELPQEDRERAIQRLTPPRRTLAGLQRAGELRTRLDSALAAGGPSAPSRIHAECRDHGEIELMTAAACSARPAVRNAVERYLRELRHVRADIRGGDLVRAGVRPGPAVAAGLAAALEAKLDGLAAGRREQLEAALAAARRA